MKLKLSSKQGLRRPVRAFVVCTSALLSLVTAIAQASLPGTGVGEVSLVIGKAWIEKPGAGRERVTVGTKVGVFDRIETASDGHVHVRFVDNGLFAVRPHSTLEIQRYDYDPANPGASAVKLNLIDGEARSISGAAGENAKENYRMNTPFAAIGVRGTDFVVNAGRREVEASINEGAIVVAPFSSTCLADALSPCTANGFELAYGANQVLQIAANTGNAVLLPATGGLPESMMQQPLPTTQPQVQAQVASRREERSGGELYAESVATLAVNTKIAIAVASGGPITTPPAVVTTPEFTPDVALSAQALQNNQLLWARTHDVARPQDRITVPFALAMGLEERKGAVNNDPYSYVLFRQTSALPNVQFGLDVVGFSLNSAQATYTSNGLVEVLDVNGGMLSIDFTEATFATSLNLRGVTLGAIDFTANGRVFDGGFFNMINGTQEMAGAATFDGKEAGYFFEKAVEAGLVEGLTLWGRQP